MPKVVFEQVFRFSPDGCTVIEYPASAEPVEVSERCAEVAAQAGVLKADEPAEPKATEQKAKSGK